ncbi:MAG: drug/metabolite exporter YedA [Nevskia sp.]|nr:drug/metabolite exporter YedA [Nevskia sp.]
MVNASPGHRVAPLLVLAALLSVYIIWGSTYLAIRFALDGYPPLFFPALRFLCAGAVLFGVLRLRGAPMPSLRQWRDAGLIGILLLNVGNGGVVLAERDVGSALAATAVATVPLWAAVFGGIWGQWPGRMQWAGLTIGFAGIVVLNLGGDFAASPLAAILLTISAATWAFGSVLSRRLDPPKGMMSSACQMLVAGVVFLFASALRGEHWVLWPNGNAGSALLYLIVFGSLLGFSAYIFLVQNVTPALATSYAYVNPVIALLFGLGLGGEHIVRSGYYAIAMVLLGVVLIVFYNRPARPPQAAAAPLEAEG